MNDKVKIREMEPNTFIEFWRALWNDKPPATNIDFILQLGRLYEKIVKNRYLDELESGEYKILFDISDFEDNFWIELNFSYFGIHEGNLKESDLTIECNLTQASNIMIGKETSIQNTKSNKKNNIKLEGDFLAVGDLLYAISQLVAPLEDIDEYWDELFD